jgi:hypothetical protein
LHPYDAENALFPFRLEDRKKSRVSKSTHAPRIVYENMLKDFTQSDLSKASFTALYRRIRNGGTTHAWMVREMYRNADCGVPELYNTVGVKRWYRAKDDFEIVYTLDKTHPAADLSEQYVTAGLVAKR